MLAAFFVAAAENGEEMEKFFKKVLTNRGLAYIIIKELAEANNILRQGG